MSAIDFIQYNERMVGEDSPDYSDTLNRALKTVVSLSDADEDDFGGFALKPAVAPTADQFYRATGVGSAAVWATLVTAMISDLTSAATGITKVGTVNTGVWQGASIATTYTDAKIKTVTGTLNRLTVSGTATDPVFDIAAAYVGQATITTLGTIATGVWNGTSIGTTYTDAKVVSITGTSNRVTIGGTATVPTVDISSSYVGQNSITTLGTVSTGTWQATAIANAYIATGLDVTKLTVGVTLPANVLASSLTSVGTITSGTWQGSSIATTYTDAKVATVTGTANRLTIGGTATAPTFDISTSYVGQATITTLGTIATGTWAATTISVDKGGTGLTSYAVGDMVYASGGAAISKLTIGTAAQFLQVNAGATAPQWRTLVAADITDLSSATTGITKVGTVTTGVWNAGIVSGIYGGTGVNNGSSTITIGGSVVFSGAFSTTITVTAGTSVTLPTTGTLVNTAVTTLASLTSVGGAFAISGAFTGATTGAFSSTVSLSQLTITDTASRIIPGATSLSLRNNANNADNLIILDAGGATFRSTLAIGGALTGVTSLTMAGALTGVTTASLSGALTYGGVTLTAAVTGTGSMALSASPTFTGTVTTAALSSTTGAFSSTVGTGGIITVTMTQPELSLVNSGSGSKNWRVQGVGNNFQITEQGVATHLTITAGGAVTFNGGVSGVTTFAASGNVAINTNKFNITATTGAFSGGTFSSTVTNGATMITTTGAVTTGDFCLADVSNTGGRMNMGMVGSVAGGISSGTSAYAFVISSFGSSLELGANNAVFFGIAGVAATPANASVGNLYIMTSSAPTGNPTGRYFLWSEGGALKGRGTSGTVTTIGPADPHCPVCGSDFGHEWRNEKYGGTLQVCVKCLVDDVAKGKPYIRYTQ